MQVLFGSFCHANRRLNNKAKDGFDKKGKGHCLLFFCQLRHNLEVSYRIGTNCMLKNHKRFSRFGLSYCIDWLKTKTRNFLLTDMWFDQSVLNGHKGNFRQSIPQSYLGPVRTNQLLLFPGLDFTLKNFKPRGNNVILLVSVFLSPGQLGLMITSNFMVIGHSDF